jgi:hypothetical protein
VNTNQQIDLKNLALLTPQSDVPKSTVYQWQRGRGRPPWRLMRQIADVLALSLADAVEVLWKETVEAPCPCGCGGTKVFPEGRPKARTLAIEIPCAKCGLKRIHKRWKKSRHRKLCLRCAASVERIEFTCVGYRDHDVTLHAQTCPRTMLLRPSDVSSRQWIKKRFPDSRFDVSTKTYQCNSCAGAERLNAWTEAQLKKARAKKYPNVNTKILGKIRTREKRLELRRTFHSEVSPPKFRATRKAQEKGRRNFSAAAAAGKTWPKMTKANLVRRWSGPDLPKRIRLGICIVCEKLVMTYSEVCQFHWSCHQKWQGTPEGRAFQSLKVRRLEASLQPTKAGRPVDEESLKRSYAYAVQHYLKEKSYGQIAKDNFVIAYTVQKRVESLIAKLPPLDLVSGRFRESLKSLIEAIEASKVSSS